MCSDVDYFPHLIMKDTLLMKHYDRRNSWSNSISSTSSSSSTSTIPITATSSSSSPSWLEKKLFSHFKRLFRQKTLSLSSNSALSSRRPSSAVDDVISLPINEQPQQEEEEKIYCIKNKSRSERSNYK